MDAFVVGGGIAGRKNSRCAAQGIHLDAGVVRQGPLAGESGHCLGLDPRVVEVGGARFLNVQPLGLGQHFQLNKLEHGADFGHLVGVAAGDHQSWHPGSPGEAPFWPRALLQEPRGAPGVGNRQG